MHFSCTLCIQNIFFTRNSNQLHVDTSSVVFFCIKLYSTLAYEYISKYVGQSCQGLFPLVLLWQPHNIFVFFTRPTECVRDGRGTTKKHIIVRYHVRVKRKMNPSLVYLITLLCRFSFFFFLTTKKPETCLSL